MVAGPGEDLREMIARLEQQELDCQVAKDSKCCAKRRFQADLGSVNYKKSYP